MKNLKLIKLLEEINIHPSQTINNDIEYLLRYMEINNEHLLIKYQTYFNGNWEEKLSKSFLFLYHNFIIKDDVRILNILFKCRKVIKGMSIFYQNENLYDLLNLHLIKLNK